jgi:hypothetical protein
MNVNTEQVVEHVELRNHLGLASRNVLSNKASCKYWTRINKCSTVTGISTGG